MPNGRKKTPPVAGRRSVRARARLFPLGLLRGLLGEGGGGVCDPELVEGSLAWSRRRT